MKPIRLIFGTALLSISLLCINNAAAQHRNNSGNHRTEKTTSHRSPTNNVRKKANTKTTQGMKANTKREKSAVGSSNRPGSSTSKSITHKETTHPKSNNRNNNDKKVDNRNNKGNSKPQSQNRTNSSNRDNKAPKPGNDKHKHTDNGKNPGGHDHKPHHDPGHKPGGHGHDPNHGHPSHHGHSAPPPGHHPHHDYKHHDYHPPRPGGGHWGPPPHNYHYHWSRPLPPPPPVTIHCHPGVPVIDMLFGVPFGMFIDYSINSLVQMGYNVLGYANNAIYMNSVPQFGYTWDDVQLYYNDGLFSSACLQYWSSSSSRSRFNSVYNQLCSLYGSPVSNNSYNGITSYTWWGGNQTGYVTLEFGYGRSDDGHAGYFTTVFYGSNY
ncbi:MAG: hypothetical protein E7079_04100 [Bacteroidales bacterium]|nr:hypothetical protein [Bacteroidales bacterium]